MSFSVRKMHSEVWFGLTTWLPVSSSISETIVKLAIFPNSAPGLVHRQNQPVPCVGIRIRDDLPIGWLRFRCGFGLFKLKAYLMIETSEEVGFLLLPMKATRSLTTQPAANSALPSIIVPVHKKESLQRMY